MPKQPAKKKDEPPKKVFDVAKPGKSAPSASSRPIIVKRQGIAQDPMVRSKDAGEVLGPPKLDEGNTEVKKIIHPTASRIVIKPDSEKEAPSKDKKVNNTTESTKPVKVEVSETTEEEAEPAEEMPKEKTPPEETTPENAKPEEPETEATESEPVEEAESTTPEENAEEPNAEPTEEKEATEAEPTDSEAEEKPVDEQPEAADKSGDAETPEATEAPGGQTQAAGESEKSADGESGSSSVVESPQPDSIVDELAKQAVNKKQKEKEDKAAAAKAEKIQKLVNDKTYFLPVGRATRRRNARRLLLALLILLVLGVVAADLAIDAGLVKTDIKPVTHFFNS